MAGWLDRWSGREAKADPPRLAGLGMGLGRPGRWVPRALPEMMRAGYQRNAIANRCVRLIAEAAASVPLVSADAGVQALISAPNGDQSGPELWETFQGYLQLAGNAYLEMVSLDGTPRQLYVLRPDRLRIRADRAGWPEGWEYVAGGRTRLLTRDAVTGCAQVFHMKLFHPGDDHYGLSPLEPAGPALDLHAAGSDWARALLANAARPSGALVFSGGDGQMTAAQFERLKGELVREHAGPDNAGRPLLLEGGLDWKPMALSPAEMDFSEARREAAREIALAFGVPPLLLGLPGDNTYANYQEANRAFWRQTVTPLVRKTARALSLWLKPWCGPGAKVEADETALPPEAG
ncbi:phage portal protein [Maricaulis sp. CAU 1757]